MDNGTSSGVAPDTATQGESDPIAQAGSSPDSVTVNSGPQTPQPQTQTPDAGQVQPTPQQPGPRVLIPEKRGGLAGLIDEFRNAVVPQQGRGVYIDPDTGERFVQHPYLTGKQQWTKLAGEALVGATAGFAAGHGAGNMAKAPFAGVQAQQQLIDKNKQNQDQQAEQDYERDKQAKLAKANSQLLATQVASNQFKLQRMEVDAGHEDVKFQQDEEANERALGSSDLGIYNFDNLHEVQAHDPDFWKHHYADDSIRSVPAYDADGKRIGIHLFLRQPGIGDQPAPEGSQALRFVPPQNPGDKPTFEKLTLSGHPTISQLDSYNAVAIKQKQDWELAQAKQQQVQSETEKNLSEVPKNAAEASNARTEAGLHSEQARQLRETGPEVQNSAQQLVEGTMDPSQLSKRSKTYDAQIAAANQYSMQTTGKPFDLAKAQSDYKFANQTGTKNTLNYLNSLVGHDNQSGNLATVVQMSKSLGNTQFPPLNDVAQWARLSAGSPQVAAYRAALLETSDQIAKILQGSSGGTSDAKLKQGQEILNSNFNAAQIAAVADKSLRPLLQNRKQEMIGDNRYLQRWYGQPASQAPPGATAEVHNQQGQLIGHVVNGAFKPLVTQ